MLCVNFYSVAVYNSAVTDFFATPLRAKNKIGLRFLAVKRSLTSWGAENSFGANAKSQ